MKNKLFSGRVTNPIPTWKTRCAGILTKARQLFLTLSVAFTCQLLMATSVYATTGTNTGDGTAATGPGKDIWQWLQTALNDLHGKFVSLSTIAACVAASICLLMMNFSTDDRAVASSRSWLQRILVSWVILNVLGFIMAYLVPLTSGGKYVPVGG